MSYLKTRMQQLILSSMRRSGKKFQVPARSKRIKEPSEKDRKARETEREKLKQLLDARKENLMVYKYFFQQDHQQISRKISESFNFLEKHSNNFLHILCHEVINLVSQKVKSISGNNNQEIFTRKYYQTIKNLMKINEQIS